MFRNTAIFMLLSIQFVLLILDGNAFAVQPIHRAPAEQFKAWNAVHDKWLATDYREILAKHGLTLSCGSCTGVSIDVIFTIDRKGSLVKAEIVSSKVCGGTGTPQLHADLLARFRGYIYPKELRKRKFRVRIGTALKC